MTVKLNGNQIYIATLVVIFLGFLVWQGRISPDAYLGIVTFIVGYYFGEYRGMTKRGG